MAVTLTATAHLNGGTALIAVYQRLDALTPSDREQTHPRTGQVYHRSQTVSVGEGTGEYPLSDLDDSSCSLFVETRIESADPARTPVVESYAIDGSFELPTAHGAVGATGRASATATASERAGGAVEATGRTEAEATAIAVGSGQVSATGRTSGTVYTESPATGHVHAIGRAQFTATAIGRGTGEAQASGHTGGSVGGVRASATGRASAQGSAAATGYATAEGTGTAKATGSAAGSIVGVRTRATGVARAAGSASATVSPTPTFAAERPALVGSTTPPRDPLVTERERLEGYAKPPFQTPTDDYGGYADVDYAALIQTFAAFAEGVATVRDEVLRSRYVDTARNQALDEIGALVLTPRRTGEADSLYRLRLKTVLQRYLGGATPQEIINALSTLLDCAPDQVGFDEPAIAEPARIDIEIPETVLAETGLSVDALVELAYLFRAGGVEIYLLAGAYFRHRSLADALAGENDISHAYAEAPYLGSLDSGI